MFFSVVCSLSNIGLDLSALGEINAPRGSFVAKMCPLGGFFISLWGFHGLKGAEIGRLWHFLRVIFVLFYEGIQMTFYIASAAALGA